MDKEKQRIAIAKACGHLDIAKYLVCEGTGMDFEDWYSGIPNKGGYAIPHYLNNLEAMYEAEETRWGDGRFRVMYSAVLSGVCNHNEIDIVHATASQRAEAFLKTLNLWETQ
jgi:hypothetical protein